MFPFALRGLAGADNPYVFATVGMAYNQNLAAARHSHRDKSLFRYRMIWIRIR